jgi:hypothetical protein
LDLIWTAEINQGREEGNFRPATVPSTVEAMADGENLASVHCSRYSGHHGRRDKYEKKEEIVADSPRRFSAAEIGQGRRAASPGGRLPSLSGGDSVAAAKTRFEDVACV